MGITTSDIKECLEKIDWDIDVASLKENEPLTEQGLDSLDVINMLFALEKDFSIEIPDTDVDKLKTINDLEAYMNKRIS